MTDPVSPTTTTGRPGTVEAAFWLYLVAPVVGLILALVGLGASTTAANTAAARAGISAGAVAGLLVTGIVLDVVFLVAVIVVDMFFRRGRNWARITLTVLAVVSFGVFTFILAVIALILSWLPASSAWFRSVKGTTAPRTL
jgi:hypothetical protein